MADSRTILHPSSSAGAAGSGEHTANSPGTGPGPCLPANSVVWAEGQPLPVRLGDIVPGANVLCYDHLGQGLKYVPVLGANVDAVRSEWVNVVLEDGTALSMTANHPLQQLDEASMPQDGNVVRARDLRPGHHTVMVLKMVPVLVQRVENPDTHEGPSTPSGREVALTVQQSERHSVFVAAAGQRPSMAVASADMQSCWEIHRSKMAEMAANAPPARRSMSAPAMSRQVAQQRSAESDPYESEASEYDDAEDVSFVIGARPTDTGMVVDSSMSSLAGMMYLNQQGLESIGAAGHDEGRCRPCHFQEKLRMSVDQNRRGRRWRPCRMGFLCTFCHRPHPPRQFTMLL